MGFLRTHPVFAAVMAAFAVLIGGEAWLLWSNGRAATALEAELQAHLRGIEALQAQRPFPSDANARAAQDDYAQNVRVLDTMLRSLNVGGPDELDYFKGEPTNRTAAYFDLATFVDAMRKLAAENGVTLAADERFGFSAYVNEGPEPETMRSVYRQRRIVEYLLRALFAARPRALVSVQREEPARADAPATPAAQRPAAAPAGGGRDLFVVDPQVSARTPGYVDTLAFQLVFSGETSSLRGFMNALAAPDLPIVVRSVEVGTTDSTRGASGRPASAARPAQRGAEAGSVTVPIVSENNTQFTVTIEFFEVKIRPPQVDTAAAP